MTGHSEAVETFERLLGVDGIAYEEFELPSGPFFIFADDTALRLASFDFHAGEKDLLKAVPRKRNDPIRVALQFLESYLAGAGATFPPLNLSGFTCAERAVYASLKKVPFGHTVSYAELARMAGYPRGARFVGNCMAKNDFPVFIPCHRVIRSDGSVGNFSGGEGIKEALLGFEQALSVKKRRR